MNRLATAAAALLLGLCAIFPTKARAEEWRWCVAGDLLDSGRTNGPNLISRPFDADGAPDFQAQYEAYARSIIGPIQGEFIINCSPPFADHDAAVRHNGEWSLSMHDMTGGLFEAEDVFWDPVRKPSSATAAAPDSSSHTEHDTVAAEPAQPTPATAATGNADAQRQAEPARPSTQVQQEDAARAEQTRQEWERKRIAAQNGGASNDASAGAAAKPLRFALWVGLRPQVGDTSNPGCYSNIITRPGPPGWGAPGFVSTATAAQADQAIDSVKAAFIAKCRAVSGREIDGTIRSSWNQTERDESELANVRPRSHDDVSVQMD